MKILLVLLLIVVLLSGCEVAKSEPDYEARISALEKAVEELEEKVLASDTHSELLSPKALETRIRVIEKMLGIRPQYYP